MRSGSIIKSRGHPAPCRREPSSPRQADSSPRVAFRTAATLKSNGAAQGLQRHHRVSRSADARRSPCPALNAGHQIRPWPSQRNADTAQALSTTTAVSALAVTLDREPPALRSTRTCSEDSSAGMRSKTAMRRRRTRASPWKGTKGECFPQVGIGVVGLAGLEPAASSLSANAGNRC